MPFKLSLMFYELNRILMLVILVYVCVYTVCGCVFTCMCVHTYVCGCVYTCMCVLTHVCGYVYTSMCAHVETTEQLWVLFLMWSQLFFSFGTESLIDLELPPG